MKKQKVDDKVLFVDASKGFIKDGNKNRLRAKDVRKIVDTVLLRKTIAHYSRLVDKSEIVENGYNLNIPRYVDSGEKNDYHDIYALMFGGIPNYEIDELNEYWDAFPSLRDEVFEKKDIPYSIVKTENIKETINNNLEVKDFVLKLVDKISQYEDYLKTELTDRVLEISKNTNV